MNPAPRANDLPPGPTGLVSMFPRHIGNARTGNDGQPDHARPPARPHARPHSRARPRPDHAPNPTRAPRSTQE